MDSELTLISRRSDIVTRNGMVACAQPLAAQAGLDILKAGGNAADAAVAVAACMSVTQPNSTGIGGDAFCLYYSAKNKTVSGINGSGRAPGNLTLDKVFKDGFSEKHRPSENHGHNVTVPGAVAAWLDTVEKFGSGEVSVPEILQPAIKIAEQGYPVTQINAHFWEKGSHLLKEPKNTHGKDLLNDGNAPKWGEIFQNHRLANVLKKIAAEGKAGYYEGEVAQAIVDVVQKFGGVMTIEDLKNHHSTYDEQISTTYKDCRVWEIPPNGQGIVALIALNILESYDLKALRHNSAEYIHLLVEALRLGFADAAAYVADPSKVSVPIDGMLSADYAKERRSLINKDKAIPADAIKPGMPPTGKDTVYFTISDCHGNACSFINSNFQGFGSGLVPENCGFTLQNRGANFSLLEGHPNAVGPNKRPYHTIIPAMVTNAQTGELMCSYGVMGGFMQPQGHVQVLLNMLLFGMTPQMALDQPRFCIGPGHTGSVGAVAIEEGIAQDVVDALKAKGHEIMYPISGHNRALMGRGHVITRGAWWKCDNQICDDTNVWWGGSDPRADGQAVGY